VQPRRWDEFEIHYGDYVEVRGVSFPYLFCTLQLARGWDEKEQRVADQSSLQATQSSDSAVREALLYPDLNILVKRKKRQERTLISSVPVPRRCPAVLLPSLITCMQEELIKSPLDNPAWLNASLATFTSDWTIVKEGSDNGTKFSTGAFKCLDARFSPSSNVSSPLFIRVHDQQ